MTKLAHTIVAIKKLKTTFLLLLLSCEIFSCNNHKSQGGTHQEVGYLMKDRTGIYFLSVKNATGNVKQDLIANPEIDAIKLVRPYDSLAEVKYPADTLTNLKDSLQGFRRSYSLAAFTAVSMDYKIDTTKFMPPEFKHIISFPFEFDGGKVTITYTFKYIQINKVSLLK